MVLLNFLSQWVFDRFVRRDHYPALDPAAPADRAILDAVQGNVLQSHGRSVTTFCFFRFPAAWDAARCRLYLSTVEVRVPSAHEVWQERNQHRANPAAPWPRPFCGLGLTAKGLVRAGVSNPEGQLGAEFSRGMGYVNQQAGPSRTPLNPGTEMGDPVDGRGHPTGWDATFRQDIHGMWLVGHEPGEDWRADLHDLLDGLEEVGCETGENREYRKNSRDDSPAVDRFFRPPGAPAPPAPGDRRPGDHRRVQPPPRVGSDRPR